jgi:hypothetical protein
MATSQKGDIMFERSRDRKLKRSLDEMKQEFESKAQWKHIPFLVQNPYLINREGEVKDVLRDSILKPYPYPEDSFNKELVHIVEGQFSIYIDGPALADVLFDKPGSDASRQCVFMTGYKWIK